MELSEVPCSQPASLVVCGGQISESDKKRFWSKVSKSDGCWIWIAGKDVDGYGYFKLRGKMFRAHRVSYLIQNGNITKEKPVIRHLCNNPACVNPVHLMDGTGQDNMDDMVKSGRQASGERNGSRLYPERRPRGNNHYSRVSPHLVARGERSYSHKHPEIRQGERNGKAKLTAVEVGAIREAYSKTKTTQKLLAVQYGMSECAIQRITSGKRWKNL